MKLIIRVLNLSKYVTISHVRNSTNKREKLSSAYNLILLQRNKMLKQEQCKFCSVAQESTEHMTDCEEVRKKVGHEIQGSLETESKCELMEISSYLEKVIKLNKKEEERNQRNE